MNVLNKIFFGYTQDLYAAEKADIRDGLLLRKSFLVLETASNSYLDNCKKKTSQTVFKNHKRD